MQVLQEEGRASLRQGAEVDAVGNGLGKVGTSVETGHWDPVALPDIWRQMDWQVMDWVAEVGY